MGIGTDNVYLINTDDAGKIDASHLGNQFDAQENSTESISANSRFLTSQPLQKVKFCALKPKAPCRSWSRLLQVIKQLNDFTLNSW